MRKLCSLVAAILVATTVQTAALASDDSDPRPGRPVLATRTSRSTATAATTSALRPRPPLPPATDLLAGLATIRARATQNLSPFNLDFVGLHVRGIGSTARPPAGPATARSSGSSPRTGCGSTRFTVRVRYGGVPEPIELEGDRASSRPTTASTSPASRTWPRAGSRSTTTPPTRRRTPSTSRRRAGARWSPTATSSTCAHARRLDHVDVAGARIRWRATSPRSTSVSSSSTRTGGRHPLRRRDRPRPVRPGRRPVDRHSVRRVAGGRQLLQAAAHTIDVPAGGATVGFTITRDTEADWDFAFVEAHTVGEDDWTTLPDLNGHTTQDTGNSCLTWPDLHPFITSTTRPSTRRRDLHPTGCHRRVVGRHRRERRPGAVAGRPRAVRRQHRRAVHHLRQRRRRPAAGVFVDDIEVSTGEGTTSFESGLDGWTVPGAPAGSPGNDNDWIVGHRRRRAASVRRDRRGSFARAAGDHRLPGRRLRPVPVALRRRHRRRRRGARVRAGDPDPSDLLQGLLHRPRLR